MSTILRRILIVPAVLVVALAAGYSALWYYAAHRLEGGFRDWTRAQTARGHSFDHGALAASGFPGPISLAIETPRFTSAKAGLQWSAERADLEMRPWDWQSYRLDIHGKQTLALPLDGAVQRLSAQSESTVVIVEVDRRGRFSQGALRSERVRITDAAGAELLSAATLRATGRAQEANPAPSGQPALDVTLRARTVTLGPQVESPLGARLDEVAFSAAVNGRVPETLLRDAVDAWRRDGGTVELAYLHLAWGALDLRANGTMALDETLRPLGALSAEIKGYGETLAALERAELLPRKAAAGSRLALDLLARRDRSDGRPVVTIPVSAQNGALYLGPVRIARLAPIPFPVR